MSSFRRFPRALAALALGSVLVAGGCTFFDRFLPGTPFTPDQPRAEVSLVDGVHVDVSSSSAFGCRDGGTMFWGAVRNSGDVDILDVTISIDAFGSQNEYLGTFQTLVFSGEVTEDASAPNNVVQVSTDLSVDAIGTFSVCSALPFGVVARTEYRTEFKVIEVDELN